MSERQCKQCQEWYDLIFFASGGTASVGTRAYKYIRSICKGCSQSNMDEAKAQNRWRAKMYNTRKTHAEKFKISARDLEQNYKWKLDQMEHDARHAYENGCPNCARVFADMGHGFADITLDITVREAAPIYGYNTRWICATCNKEKGQYTMQEYAILKVMWQRWENRKKNRWEGTLLAGMTVDTGTKAKMEYRRRGD